MVSLCVYQFLVRPACLCVRVLLARELWKLWNDLQSEGLRGYFYPSECNLARRYNVAQHGVASLTLVVFTSRTGWDSVVVVGDKHSVGGWGRFYMPTECWIFASSYLAAPLVLFYFIEWVRKSCWSDCTVSVTGSLHGRVLCHWCLKFKQHASCFSTEWSNIWNMLISAVRAQTLPIVLRAGWCWDRWQICSDSQHRMCFDLCFSCQILL